ncbi:MAG: hypothetical protein ACK6BM_00855 [Cyanobacteriota bacterium]|jgi:hypothetical protein
MTTPFQKSTKTRYSAIAWALLSQSIWLPVLVIDTQDRLASKTNDYSFSPQVPHQQLSRATVQNLATKLSSDPELLIAKSTTVNSRSGIILNAILPGTNKHVLSEISIHTPADQKSSPVAFSVPPAPNRLQLALQPKSGILSFAKFSTSPVSQAPAYPDLLGKMYSKAELLGGVVSLQDLSEPDMPPIARAERAQWALSGDPLAPIPQVWRESMRKALQNLSTGSSSPEVSISASKTERSTVNSARVIHIPSSKVRRSADVPLALQSDGSVDILNSPDDPAVVEEIKTWSSKQVLPSKGSISPAIVHLHHVAPQNETVINRQQDKQAEISTQESIVPASVPIPPAADQAPVQQASEQPTSVNDLGNVSSPEAVSSATATETSPTSEVKP